MPTFRLSRRAETDLMEIGEYTVATWGEKQAVRYLDDLEPVVSALLTTQPLAAHVTIYAPACVAWNKAAT